MDAVGKYTARLAGRTVSPWVVTLARFADAMGGVLAAAGALEVSHAALRKVLQTGQPSAKVFTHFKQRKQFIDEKVAAGIEPKPETICPVCGTPRRSDRVTCGNEDCVKVQQSRTYHDTLQKRRPTDDLPEVALVAVREEYRGDCETYSPDFYWDQEEVHDGSWG